MTTPQRVAVVTGGTGAIGSAIVKALEHSGHKVVTLGRSGEFQCDLESGDSIEAAAAAVLEQHSSVDVLVHCAGVYDPITLEDFDLGRWRRLMAINVEAALWLAKAFVPGMRENKFGRIVLISSDGQWTPPNEEFLAYLTSKAAMLTIARTLAVAYGVDGISVTAVAPGLTDTSLSRTVADDMAFKATVATQAMKRPLTPEDTARTVDYLASDAGEALTGQVLVVDGGVHMR